MKKATVIIFFILSIVINITAQENASNEYYAWHNELKFRLFDDKGEIIIPSICNKDDLNMYAPLPEIIGNQSLRFDIDSHYFIYTQSSDASEDKGIVFTLGKDTMSILLPNHSYNSKIDSIPLMNGQFFISDIEWAATDKNFDKKEEILNRPQYYFNSVIDDWTQYRFNQENYEEKIYPHILDSIYFEDYYKQDKFNKLSKLKSTINTAKSLSCSISFVEYIPFLKMNLLTKNDKYLFYQKDYFIIDNKEKLLDVFGEDSKDIDIDLSKEIILFATVGGDCMMWLSHEIEKDNSNEKITWKIYNHWGRCRAGGHISTWIKIKKPSSDFVIEKEIILVD